jgi:hypothetical protein
VVKTEKEKKGRTWLFPLYMLVLFLPCLELALLIVGYRPYRQVPFRIDSEPEFCLIPHPNWGFALRPGEFVVWINDSLTYSVQHGEDSLRRTSHEPVPDSLPQVFILGCSYTYGMGEDDENSFPFLLQHKFPQYKIRNFGVPGYGNVQVLLQLQKALREGTQPEMVIVNYADFHNERNVLSPAYRRSLHLGFERSHPSLKSQMLQSRVPYVAATDSGIVIREVSWAEMYQNWWGREWLASVNLLQQWSDRWANDAQQAQALTIAVFLEINRLCAEREIPLLVTGLNDTPQTHQTLSDLSQLGIQTLDMGLDLFSPAYNHQPYDEHPNAAAHRHFAERLGEYLSK